MKHLYTVFFALLLTTLSFLPAKAVADKPDPLTIYAREASTVKFYYGTTLTTKAHEKLSYRIDNGSWNAMSGNTKYDIPAGSKMYIRGMCKAGINNSNNTSQRYQFRFTGSVDLGGDLMSLIDSTQKVTTIPCTYCFFWLFYSNSSETEKYNRFSINSAEDLSLSATTLTASCYEGLFRDCQNLIEGPNLSAATNIPANAFKNFFYNCKSMTDSPALPSVEAVGESGFYEMFYHCDALKAFPALNNYSTLGNSAYRGMFSYCTTAKTAPELPATTIGTNCYQNMFIGCTALEEAPELPATTLATDCYNAMFSGCSSLTDAPSELPATTLVARCYKNMFNGCSSLVDAPVIKAISIPANSTADAGCMEYMFQGCNAIRNIKVYFTAWDTNAHNNTKNATYGWLTSASDNAQCRFLYPYGFQNPTADRGENRIPTNWNPLPFYTYTFNVSNNGGTWDGTTPATDRKYERVHGEQLTSAPSNPQKEGYKFKGWYTTANDDSETGSKIELNNMTALNANQTFYARFELPAYTFDVATNGGTWDGTSSTANVIYSLETLPSNPQKEDCNFTGWFTTANDDSVTGVQLTGDNKNSFTTNTTFYARFEAATPPTPDPEPDPDAPQQDVEELDDTQDNTSRLTGLTGNTVNVLLKGRTLVGGCVNTLCLPFSLTNIQLAASPLAGCAIWEFNSSTFEGGTLDISVTPAESLTAGVPYLVEPTANVTNLRFNGVTISASTASTRGNNVVRFVGLLSPYTLTAGSQDELFVGSGNKLLRPSVTTAIRGFRAWFHLNDGQVQAAPRARLTFGEKPQVPTAIDNTEKDNTPRKIFINGQLYITHDGTTYTPAGNIMPK